jgi:hypothetical protein
MLAVTAYPPAIHCIFLGSTFLKLNEQQKISQQQPNARCSDVTEPVLKIATKTRRGATGAIRFHPRNTGVEYSYLHPLLIVSISACKIY